MIRLGTATTGTAIAALIMLTACAPSLYTASPKPMPESHREACGNMAEFYAAVPLLSDGVGQEMLQVLSLNQAWDENPCDQLRGALLLSKPGTVFRDDAKASKLLRDFLDNPGNAHHPDRALASLLAEVVDERQWLQAERYSLEKTITQEQGVSYRLAQILAQILKRERTTAKSLRSQLDMLQSQLDQLKSIERDINEKEQSAATPTVNREPDEPNQDTSN